MNTSDLFFLMENSWLKYDLFFSKSDRRGIKRKKEEFGEFNTMYQELRESPHEFCKYTGLSIDTFDYILSKISTRLTKCDTNFRVSIKPEEKLFATLRYLSTGKTFMILANRFKMGRSTFADIVYNTCNAIWIELIDIHMSPPSKQQWKKIAEDFYRISKFPNCIGCIDNIRCFVKKRPQGGPIVCKRNFPITLQAVADAEKRLIIIEVDGSGKHCDKSHTFNASNLQQLLETEKFNIPRPNKLPESNVIAPYVLVGDECYALKHYLVRPFSERKPSEQKQIFNERVFAARQSIQCVIGVLTTKWKVISKPIGTNVDHGILIIKTICLLHNIVRDLDGDTDPDYVAWNLNNTNYTQMKKKKIKNIFRNSTGQAKIVRNRFINYFYEKSRS